MSRQHDPVTWKAHARIEKFLADYDSYLGRYADPDEALLAFRVENTPYETLDRPGNLLMTVGATALWNGLVTTGLATPFSSTNAQIAVGDASTAATAADTDMGAAAGSSLGGGITGATNATPIVLTTASAHGVVVGQVVVVASVGGNTAANATFEVSAVTSTTITLLNSAGNGAYTSGGTVKLVNKYRQLVNGAPSVSTNQVQFVSVFGTTSANHAWQEWGVATGGAATNKQASPPPTLLNHAVTNLGTKTIAASWTFTVSLTLS